MALTDFEADLIKLQWVWYRLQGIYPYAPKIPLNNQGDRLFSQIIREMIILQLDNFIVVRRKLCKYTEIKKLDSQLDLLWKPIFEYEKPIRLIRNNYIAHIQDKKKPFQIMVQEIVNKYHFPTSFGDWVFLCGCGAFYSGIIEVNYRQQIVDALAKYDTQSPPLKNFQKYIMSTYKQHLGQALQKTVEKLKKNGYKTIGS